MAHLELARDDGIGTLTLSRGKVNAIDPLVVQELTEWLAELRNDDQVRAVVLTGAGKFFSFGFDIPQLLPFSREEFAEFLRAFTGLYAELFTFPKPMLASLNGHTIAGGCMLAIACDHRIMVADRGKISLNEITFGASVFAGAVAILRCRVGHANAERILISGKMFSPREAFDLGLVDDLASAGELADATRRIAAELAGRDAAAYASMKRLLRGPVADGFGAREEASIREFVDIWYSPATRKSLEKIEIR